ncbi:MAG: hypothetical protein IAE84_18755 [Saprospiraceae bacterium]|jgi:hypothetical protein|nr:hypothetical protein [Saprospiraceae bacterium]HRD82292.1 hypothetical protein [Saprospiraceae bacterium]
MKSLTILLLLSGLFLAGCYYDNEEDLYPSNCNTDSVTYSGDVAPIISTNCLVCHSTAANLGNVRLEGYTALKTYVTNGKLLGAIKHQSGFSAMPQNAPKLSACNIAKIQKWVDDGALDN